MSLDAEIKKVKPSVDTESLLLGFSASLTLAVIDLVERMPMGVNPWIDQIKRKFLYFPNYTPTASECMAVAKQALLYREMQGNRSGLRQRLLAQDGEDMPDSLADPEDL